MLTSDQVGIVSTARLTHATPAAMYSHCPMRNWEADTDLPPGSQGCVDIATQLLESMEAGKVVLALGGGRRSFQTDSRDLITRWIDGQGRYMATTGDLRAWDKKGRALGLFSSSHMDWEVEREQGEDGQPSLAEMTRAALERLQGGDNQGFMLMVEAGRIDHAHHQNMAKMAMEETLALEEAVQVVMEMTAREDTLVIVTADHSHAVTINGYPERGNPILGSVLRPSRNLGMVTDSGIQPFTTISYANGPGYKDHFDPSTGFWRNITGMDLESNTFRQMGAFYLPDETHGGEDVTVYAIGPQVSS